MQAASQILVGVHDPIAGPKPAPASVSSITGAVSFPPTIKHGNPLGVISEGYPTGPVFILPAIINPALEKMRQQWIRLQLSLNGMKHPPLSTSQGHEFLAKPSMHVQTQPQPHLP